MSTPSTVRIRTHFEDGDPVNFPPEFLTQEGKWIPVYFLERTAKGVHDYYSPAPTEEAMWVAQRTLDDYRLHALATAANQAVYHEPL